MNQILPSVAQAVARSIDQRRWDQHRVFSEELVNRLFCHHLLAQCPDFESRLWIAYRPWPEESTESIGYWIDGDGDQSSMAVEVHIDDPRDASAWESAGVWGSIIGDTLRLATAMGHRNLGRGYILLFGELRHDAKDHRINQFPLETVGETRCIETSDLLSSTVMDAGFFEEILHPHELVPTRINVRLVTAEAGSATGYWVWEIGLPD